MAYPQPLRILKNYSTMQTFEQAAEKLTNWWAEQSFGGKINQNNGDDSPRGGVGFALANWLSLNAQKDITDQKIGIFKETLKADILKNEWNYITIMTDYHPDKILCDACEVAGISTDCIPIKTCTWIKRPENIVTVSLGYGGNHIEI